jgi:aspartyl-tRNA(Asn)/glutamyl-tRNA(Gln) amidotransferase subunit C
MSGTTNPIAEDAADGSVTLEDVRRVAELANLELSGDEETRMLRDLNAILGHVAQLNELDTTSVVAMAQVSDAFPNADQRSNTTRPDTVVPSLDRRTVLASGPDNDGVFFKVPKVIER